MAAPLAAGYRTIKTTVFSPRRFCCRLVASILCSFPLWAFGLAVSARSNQKSLPAASVPVYQQLKAAVLDSHSIATENLVLKRDRVTISFICGTLYFAKPVNGEPRGAVFIGRGTFQATPPDELERGYVHRMINVDEVASDFKTAVLRFTDDTFSILDKTTSRDTVVPPEAVKLAAGLDSRVLEQTGANISARQVVSILNHESPGFFFGEFDGGHRGRFDFLLDAQSRIPVAYFGIDAGERGLIYNFNQTTLRPDVWMAFHSKEEYKRGVLPYPDASDLIKIPRYAMDVDVTQPKKMMLNLTARMDCVSRSDHLIAIPFVVGEDLQYFQKERLKYEMSVISAHMSNGAPVEWIQEPWEGGFTVILPSRMDKGERFTLELSLGGKFVLSDDRWTYFPLGTITWYPRQGSLRRSKFDLIFRHNRNDVVASIGSLIRDDAVPGTQKLRLTEFRLDQPTTFVSFLLSDYKIHRDTAKTEEGRTVPIELYSLPVSDGESEKTDFMLAEFSNCIRYFSKIFGQYPYPVFRAVYYPASQGISFPTTLMIPRADTATVNTFRFISHEAAHQWWGDNVQWRSYRDLWLSEGFAEYASFLYTQMRAKDWGEKRLIQVARMSLLESPGTLTGIGAGRLEDVGPLLMGSRLRTSETQGAFTALVYNKGALVMRMLHFLFIDPHTGNGKPFFDMMADFQRRYAGGVATTAEFFAVANEHLGQTAIARQFGYKDLDWFYRQWVLETYLPSYKLTYHLEDQSDGSVLLKGTLIQDGLPDNEHWFMPLPLLITYTKGQKSVVPIAVHGKSASIEVRLLKRPKKIELDPEMWVLSENTTTKHTN